MVDCALNGTLSCSGTEQLCPQLLASCCSCSCAFGVPTRVPRMFFLTRTILRVVLCAESLLDSGYNSLYRVQLTERYGSLAESGNKVQKSDKEFYSEPRNVHTSKNPTFIPRGVEIERFETKIDFLLFIYNLRCTG